MSEAPTGTNAGRAVRLRVAVVRAARRHVGPRRRAVALAGAALAVGGALSPWATFAFGYPGKMTLAGFPGGARSYLLVLVVPALLCLVDIPGRRAASAAGAGGVRRRRRRQPARRSPTTAAGSVPVAYGAWLATAGALAAVWRPPLACPDGRPADRWPAADPDAASRRRRSSPPRGRAWLGVWYGLEVGRADPLRLVHRRRRLRRRPRWPAWVGARVGWRPCTSATGPSRSPPSALAAAAFPFTQDGNAYWIRVFASIGVFAAAAIGLNVVVGLAGLLDLGYVAFFGVGAYVAACFGGAG